MTNDSKPAAVERIAALDGIRGLAAALVLVFHFLGFSASLDPVMVAITRVAELGSAGVDLFFVLSGFLITGILVDTRHDRRFFRNFYVRRVLRIFPLYYGVLLLIFVGLRASGSSGEAAQSLRAAEPWAWAYVMNFFVGIEHIHTYIDHFWSLAVEEHFYLVWPLVVWAFRRRLDGLLVTCVVVATLSRSARFAGELNGLNEFATSWFTPFRLDALCFGAGIAILMRRPGGQPLLVRAVPLLTLAGSVLFLAQAGLRYLPERPSPLAQPADSFGLVLLFGALVIRATLGRGRWLSGLLLNRPLLLLGKYSYGVYVFHAVIARYLWIRQPDAWLAQRIGSAVLAFLIQAALATAVSIGIAVLSYELYERRFLALKARFSS